MTENGIDLKEVLKKLKIDKMYYFKIVEIIFNSRLKQYSGECSKVKEPNKDLWLWSETNARLDFFCIQKALWVDCGSS